MAKLVFGCGYLGFRVARRWLAGGVQPVAAVTRSASRADQLSEAGLQAIVADISNPVELTELSEIETVLFAVGFDRSSGQTIHDVYAGGLQNVLRSLPKSIGRFIYISSTGVYGQTGGQWVDEESPCRPQRAGGQACLAAESVLAEHRLGSRSIVLRLAGLYGPGRIPRGDTVAAGQPLEADPDRVLNLIHVDDAVEAVLAAERAVSPSRCYLVSDGHPVLRRQFYAHWAELIGAPTPRFIQPDPGEASRDRGDKRVANGRMLEELGVRLQFPDYRQGLSAIFGAS